MEKNNKEKKCWACKRILVTKSKIGLCPNCVNKYGSPVLAAAVLGTGVIAKVGISKLIKK